MSSSTWTLCVCLLSCSVSEGQQQITVKTGDDVTLQCLNQSVGDIEMLEWTRRGLNVFVWKRGKMSEDHQHESFKNRVELRDPQMKDGDVSVILKNVNINDTGTYECYVKNNNTQPPPQLICIITLTVTGSVKTVHPREDVLLPCQGPRGAKIVYVKWNRPELESEGSVFLFRDGRTYENYQVPSFHGRVKLRDPQMKDGDVSVILKNVSIKDTGTYECHVGTKGNSPELISSVHLKFKASNQQQIAVKTGDDVSLQCLNLRGGDIKLLAWRRWDLDEDVFVWKHGNMSEDPQHPSFKNRVVLRDSQMKDGDVSVILKNVTINDTGTYECHMAEKGRSSQLITTVTLTVRDSGGGAGPKELIGLVVGLSAFIVLVVFLFVVGFTVCSNSQRLKKHIYEPPDDEANDPELQDLSHESKEKMKEEVEDDEAPVQM